MYCPLRSTWRRGVTVDGAHPREVFGRGGAGVGRQEDGRGVGRQHPPACRQRVVDAVPLPRQLQLVVFRHQMHGHEAVLLAAGLGGVTRRHSRHLLAQRLDTHTVAFGRGLEGGRQTQSLFGIVAPHHHAPTVTHIRAIHPNLGRGNRWVKE